MYYFFHQVVWTSAITIKADSLFYIRSWEVVYLWCPFKVCLGNISTSWVKNKLTLTSSDLKNISQNIETVNTFIPRVFVVESEHLLY